MSNTSRIALSRLLEHISTFNSEKKNDHYAAAIEAALCSLQQDTYT